VRNISLIIATLLFVGGVAGAGYVYYIGTTEPVEPAALPAPPTQNKIAQATTKPKAKPTGPVGVSIQVLTSPVKPGGNASLTIRTRPDAACSVKVTYKDQASTDGGLIPKTADEFGLVQWTWTVESSRPVGTWPVDVTCALGDMSGYVRGDLEVSNS
jgi:hypothetical protein